MASGREEPSDGARVPPALTGRHLGFGEDDCLWEVGQELAPCLPAVIFSFKALTLDSSTEGPWTCTPHELGGWGAIRVGVLSSQGWGQGLRRGPLSGCGSGPCLSTAEVTCMGLAVLLLLLDPLEEKTDRDPEIQPQDDSNTPPPLIASHLLSYPHQVGK